jgi:hypothetical protein
MTNKNNTRVKPLAILAAVSLSFIGGPLVTAAKASNGGFQAQPAANQYLIAQNQQQCTVNSAGDPRGGADLRNNPIGQNIGFVNNGTVVKAQQLSPDGQWRWVITQDGTQQGWMYQPYLNCGGRQASNVGSSNMTGGIAIGTTCTAVGSPQYPSVPIRDYPNATGNQIGNFAKGTQLRVVTPPAGQQSQSKWTYVQSVENPGLQGWVWRNYVSCN